eukprot:TRINITY_DN5749_c3_g1_i2.p1 TRINITY_DN5749_c3_g1~~TRINITY_DN5749_c3_g1_i2.p1  ORF type:complete len:238 (+),score=74.91 TRINITY_DN5749_c3_g1_i2:106-819(+)
MGASQGTPSGGHQHCSRGGAELLRTASPTACASGRCYKAACGCAPPRTSTTTPRASQDDDSIATVPESIVDDSSSSCRCEPLDDAAAALREKERRFNKGKFILPGSVEQAELARRAREQAAPAAAAAAAAGGDPGCAGGAAEEQAECVMCLDGFSWDNPAVLTLCACGVNRASFHYACLLQYKARSSRCPACRAELFYEERQAPSAAAAAAAAMDETPRIVPPAPPALSPLKPRRER